MTSDEGSTEPVPVPAAASRASLAAPLTIALGPPEHGVTRFAVDCARAAGTELIEVGHVGDLPAALATALPATPPRVSARSASQATPLHLHVTDPLFGPTPEDAAAVIEHLARDRPVAVTLHDVPQPAEGGERCRRRGRGYQRIAAVAGLVVVSSEHERTLCADAGIEVDAVIPLPVPALAVPERLVPDARSVGVFGFLHPGKAVDVVAEAVAHLAAAGDEQVTLRLVGQPADGHEEYVRAALGTVRAAGGRAEVTGRVDDDELARSLGEVTVPVALFRNVSASGSLNTWAAAGRRPVTTDSAYTREIEHDRPGSLLLAEEADLAGQLRRLLDDPAVTRREPPPPGLDELGRGYADAWREWLA